MNKVQIAAIALAGAFTIGVASASAVVLLHQPNTGELIVKLRDSNGLPIRGVVALAGYTQMSDVNGRAEFVTAKIGTEELSVTAVGYRPQRLSVTITQHLKPLAIVTLISELPTTHSVSLSVVDWLSGVPMPDVIATVNANKTISDPSGNVQLTALAPGTYQLNLSKPGYREYVQTLQITTSNVLLPAVKLMNNQRFLAIKDGVVQSGALDGSSKSTIAIPLGVPASLFVGPDGAHAVILTKTPEDLLYAWASKTEGTSIRQLSTIKVGTEPIWSPDGKKVLIIDSQGLGSLFSADGQRLGQLSVSLYEGTFSKDNLHVLSAGISGTESVLTMSNSDGSAAKTLVSHSEMLSGITLSDDGKTAYAYSQNGTATQHFNVDTKTGVQTQTPSALPSRQHTSRSAQTELLARINVSGNPELLQSDGTIFRVVNSLGTADLLQAPYFSADGTILFFGSLTNGLHSISAVPVKSGLPLIIPLT